MPVARQRRRRDGQQRAAQAVARRVHGMARRDGFYGLQRGAKAQVQVVVHAQIAVVFIRVLP